jgi:1-acyl-sn-glycerol-3-phosphate acyltransferase
VGAHLKAAARLVRVLLHAVGGWFTILLVFPRLDEAQRNARVELWSARMLRLMGVALRVEGAPPSRGPVLLVANHISWLDILVMHAARHCRFVAKSEVRHWPLIGRLATGGGTLYIERESRRDAMRVVHHMAESLARGEIVAVFPEGTTGDGITLLPFHANLIQAAVSTGAPVQPLALKFVDTATGRPSPGPSYIGEETLAQSVWRTLAGGPITAVVRYGEPQRAQGRGRRAWAASLRDEVERLRA